MCEINGLNGRIASLNTCDYLNCKLYCNSFMGINKVFELN